MRILSIMVMLSLSIMLGCSDQNDDPEGPVFISAMKDYDTIITPFNMKDEYYFKRQGVYLPWEGNIDPFVQWNGEPGNIVLSSDQSGIAIAPNGDFQLENGLRIGYYPLKITARNSLGETSVYLTLQSSYAGGSFLSWENDGNSMDPEENLYCFFHVNQKLYDCYPDVDIDWLPCAQRGEWSMKDDKTIVGALDLTDRKLYFTMKIDYDEDSGSVNGKGFWYNNKQMTDSEKGGFIELKSNIE